MKQGQTQAQLKNNLEMYDTYRVNEQLEKYHLYRESFLGGQLPDNQGRWEAYGAHLMSRHRTWVLRDFADELGVWPQASRILRGHFERDLREMVSGYPSSIDGGLERFDRLGNLDIPSIVVHNGMHFQKHADNQDYKLAVAPSIHAKHTMGGGLHDRKCHYTVIQDDDGISWVCLLLLLFSCTYLSEKVDCAYVQYLIAVAE